MRRIRVTPVLLTVVLLGAPAAARGQDVQPVGDEAPAVSSCTPRAFPGETICVCGHFPDSRAQFGLMLGGRPLGPPIAASSTAAIFHAPDVSPGRHMITGDPGAGFPAGAGVPIRILAIGGDLARDPIFEGQRTTARVWLKGTEEDLVLNLVNHSPQIASLEGGNVQTLTISEINEVRRQVLGLQVGEYILEYWVDPVPCPCHSPAEVPDLALAEPREPRREPEAPEAPEEPEEEPEEPYDEEPWVDEPIPPTEDDPPPPDEWPPPPEEDPPPPEEPPPPPDEELREEDRCCGLAPEGVLTFPRVTDPMTVPEVPIAPRDAAVVATQVVLPKGAYAHNDVDLEIDAVGFPFRWSRHYLSDAKTEGGGVIGHNWDFSMNKRLIPHGVPAGRGLMYEMIGSEPAVLDYFDGHGHGAQYVAPPGNTNRRRVLNFGVRQPFEAYVTTYISPPGVFHEIQRYVLVRPEEHPFASHPAVDAQNEEAIFYVLREKNGLRYVFNCRGQLIYILHRNDYASVVSGGEEVRTALYYDGLLNPLTQNRMLSRIVDTSGHTYTIRTRPIGQALLDTNISCTPWNTSLPIPRIHKVLVGGTEIEYVYQGQSDPILESVRFSYPAAGREPAIRATWRYEYDGAHRLLRAFSPRQASGGVPYIANTYSGDRVQEQRMGGERRYTIAYKGSGAVVTDAAGYTHDYTLGSAGPYQVIAEYTVKDPRTQASSTTKFQHNGYSQITRIDMPRGNAAVFTYDERNDPVTLGPIRNWLESGLTYVSDLSEGNLLSITREAGSADPQADPSSLVTSTTYEPLFNEVATLTDARRNTTTYHYTYDRQGDMGNRRKTELSPALQPDGSRLALPPVEYTYTARGQLEATIEGPHRRTAYTYEPGTGYLVRVDLPGGAQRSYNVDAFGRVLREGGSFGTMAFDRNGRGFVVRRIRAPGGMADTIRYRWDLDGNLVETQRTIRDQFEPRAAVEAGGTTARLPARSSPVTVTTTRTVDVLGRPTGERIAGSDGKVHEITRRFDTVGRLASSTSPSPTGSGTVATTYQYDARGLLVEETSAGLVQWYEYDANGNRITSGEGRGAGDPKRSYHYDGFDRKTGFTDALGTHTEWRLDGNGNVVQETIRGRREAEGANNAELLRVNHDYNEHDLLISSRIALLDDQGGERRTQYFYNDDLALWRIVNPMGGVTEFLYDEAGRPWHVEDPLGNRVQTTYDLAGRKTEVVETDIEWSYDRANGAWNRREAGYSTSFAYDELGRLISTAPPTGAVRYFYDSADHLRVALQAEEGLVESRYNGLGWRVTLLANGVEQTMDYAPSGHLAELRGPMTHTRWSYDAHGREISTEDVLNGGVTRIDRDALGNPEKVTDPNGTVVGRAFNAIGLPTEVNVTYGTRGLVVGDRRIPTLVGPFRQSFAYDGLGRILEARTWESNDPTTQLAFRYDGLGQVTYEEQVLGTIKQTLTRSYAPDGSWSEVVYPELAGAATVRSHFNPGGQVSRVDLDGEMLVSYLYDGPDRVSGRSARNGTLTDFGYDRARRLDQVVVLKAGEQASLANSRAFYEGSRIASFHMSYAGDPQRPAFTSATEITYDERRRPVSTLTWSSAPVGSEAAKEGLSVTASFTEYDGDRPKRMAEVMYRETAEAGGIVENLVSVLLDRPPSRPLSSGTLQSQRTPSFARTIDYTYEGSRVASVRTVARSSFSRAMGDAPASVADIDALVTGGDRFDFAQEYNYDANGNLTGDGANVYAYDFQNRLKQLEQIAAGQWYTQRVAFTYDAFGRRLEAYPTRREAPVGFVDWAPWKRTRQMYLYDGPHAVAEVVLDPDGERRAALLARYFLGAQPFERIRMDRRVDEDLSGSFTPHYFHTDVEGTFTFLTDGNSVPHSVIVPPGRAGATVRPPDDLRFIGGTSTHSPYLSGDLRIDTYAGVRYSEGAGRTLYDYRSTHQLADMMDLAEMRRDITTMQNRVAILVLAQMAIAYAPVQATIAGLVNAGMAHQTAYWSGTPYTSDELLGAFSEGAISGSLGAAFAPIQSGLARAVVGNYAADYITGVGIDVGWRGRDLSGALVDNVLNAATGAGINIGIGLGTMGFRKALSSATRRAVNGAERTVPFLADHGTHGAGPTGKPQGGASGDVFADLLQGRTGSGDLSIQIDMMWLLLNGSVYDRAVAQMIIDGHIRVQWDPSLGGSVGGRWSKGQNVVNLNPHMYRGNPRLALSAAGVIVHEATHAFGGGEVAAHIAQAAFLHRWKVQTLSPEIPAAGRAQIAAYDLAGAHKSLVGAYVHLIAGPYTDVVPLLTLISKSYGVNVHGRGFYMRPGYAQQHFVDWIRRAGGWERILGLDPDTAYLLQRAAEANNGLTF